MNQQTYNASPNYITARHTQFLRIAKLKGAGKIEIASRHNLREIQAELGSNSHIDPLKSPLNIILRGQHTAKEVAQQATNLMNDAKVLKPRKDAVRALEIVFSLPPSTTIDTLEFFSNATGWTEAYFQVPIISAVIHHDEEAPHCHVLMLPLINGRLVGSDLMGNRKNLEAMQNDFYLKVAQGYGLQKPAKAKQHTKAKRLEAGLLITNAIKENPSCLKNPKIAGALIEALSIQMPERLIEAMGIVLNQEPKAKAGEFARIMTKPMKRESKAYRVHDNKPYRVQSINEALEKANPMLCRVPNFTNSINTQKDSIENELTRHRDDSISSEYWDSSTGQFATQ